MSTISSRTRRLAAAALSVLMSLSLVPVPALAEMVEGADDVEVVDVPESAAKPNAAQGDMTVEETPVEDENTATGAVSVGGSGDSEQEAASSERDAAEVAVDEQQDKPSAEVSSNGANSKQDAVDADDKGILLSVQDANNVVASGTWGTCPWQIDASFALVVRPGEAGPASERPWRQWASQVTSVTFAAEGAGRVALPADCSGLFSGFSSATSMDLSGADASSVTSMSSMFYYCSSLASLDLSGWDTSKVTSMNEVFSGCSRSEERRVGKECRL